MTRFLRQLQTLETRYRAARFDELRTLITVQGGVPLATGEAPRVHLIPQYKIIGGMPEVVLPLDPAFEAEVQAASFHQEDVLC
jgi:hypothetical protein